MALRAEAVAEEAGGFLTQLPFRRGRPKRGKFATGKTGAHADHGIVPRNGIATEEHEGAGGGERERRTARLAGEENIGSDSGETEQGGELFRRKMVEK